jgi:alpha-beta hydrolase superfamily lysophospholipase
MERLRTDQVSEKAYPGAKHEIFDETNRDEVIGDAVVFSGQILRPSG